MDSTNTAPSRGQATQRVAWPVERWPEPDRLAWARARQPGDFLADGGAAAAWRPATVCTTVDVYGRFLAFLDGRGWLDPRQSPAERLTAERLGAYVEHLDVRCASVSVASTVAHLHVFLKVLAPDADCDWMRALGARLRRRAEPSRNKRLRVISSRDLLALGRDLMDLADAEATGAHIHVTCTRAVRYRDGLIIALLSLCPLRLKNFAALELGRNLIRTGTGYTIYFPGSETKARQPIDHLFPSALVPALERYLEHYRAGLLSTDPCGPSAYPNGKSPDGRLWISRQGKALSRNCLYIQITKRTRVRFGQAVNPHLFRDCAATTIAEEVPSRVRMSAGLLGHTDFRTTEAHYIVAHTRSAGANYQQLILRKRAAGGSKDRL